MRHLKLFALILLFVLSMLFFVQNSQALSSAIVLELDLLFVRFTSVPLTVSFLALAGFFLGGCFTLGFLLLDRLRLVRELKALRKKHEALEDEALTLRTLPLNQPANAPACPPQQPAGGSAQSGE